MQHPVKSRSQLPFGYLTSKGHSQVGFHLCSVGLPHDGFSLIAIGEPQAALVHSSNHVRRVLGVLLRAQVEKRIRPDPEHIGHDLRDLFAILNDRDPVQITFVPHLLPVNRGILSTMYLAFQRAVSSQELQGEYERRYRSRPFVRVLGATRLPELRAVKDSNFCDIAWRLTHNGTRAVIFSAIDNLVKGAAGQAVQNFNLMHGLDESMALLEGEPVAIHG